MATNNSTMRVSDLDFSTIKNNLITFMQSQDAFTDMNFAGSALNTIIDLLSYNTYYNSIIANAIVNESFLDSATSRGAVISKAKAIGYYPTSYVSPKSLVNITVNSPVGNPTSIILPKGSNFTSTIDGVNYKFITLDNYETSPVAGIYTFHNVQLFEGTLSTYSYVVDTTNTLQHFIIPNQAADLSSLKVYIQNSSSDATLTLYTQNTDITKLLSTTTAYFIQGTMDSKYEIYFGDNILGKAVIDGNIVILEFLITAGSSANNAKVFRSANSIAGSTSIAITTIEAASGGTEFESTDSIKRNAPKAFSTQNRMVTAEDIKTLLPILYSNIRSVSVWGGDENIPPDYGTVYVSIEPLNYGTLTVAEKTDIIDNIIGEKKIISIQYKIIDPEYIFLNINSTVYYDQSISLNGIDTIKLLAKNAIMIYNNTELAKFKDAFRFSKLSSLIDNIDKSVISNITTFKLKKYIVPVYGQTIQYDVNFYNPIYKNSNELPENAVSSSGFTIAGDIRTFYLDDDGKQYIRMYYLDNITKIYTNNNVGSIDYIKGRILINLNISTFLPVNISDIGMEIIVVPQSNDVIPVRNTILRIRETDVVTNAMIDIIADGNKSGANYNFTSSR